VPPADDSEEEVSMTDVVSNMFSNRTMTFNTDLEKKVSDQGSAQILTFMLGNSNGSF